MNNKSNFFPATLGIFLLIAGNAEAHTMASTGTSMFAGIMHPMLGLDHLLAMIAVGLWVTKLEKQAQWTLPLVFISVMLAGFGLARLGWNVAMVEPLLAASVLLLGLLIAGPQRLSLMLSVFLVSLFGLLHGYAHGIEVPASGSIWLYVAGFMLTCAVLQATGLAIGQILGRVRGAMTLWGAAIATTGMALLSGL
jgi:urease accessory protein